jgi:hypothetical protein
MGIAEDRSTLATALAKRRRLPRWAKGGMVLSVLVIAFVVLALQQGGDGGGGGPLNAIAQAAEKTQSEPGGRVSMRAVVSNGSRRSRCAARWSSTMKIARGQW